MSHHLVYDEQLEPGSSFHVGGSFRVDVDRSVPKEGFERSAACYVIKAAFLVELHLVGGTNRATRTASGTRSR